MNKQLKKKWVKALLSGEYEQCAGGLANGFGGYCCLGVLHKIVTGQEPPTFWSEFRPQPFHLSIDESIEDELADLNDSGVPFDMIAGLIDQAL